MTNKKKGKLLFFQELLKKAASIFGNALSKVSQNVSKFKIV